MLLLDLIFRKIFDKVPHSHLLQFYGIQGHLLSKTWKIIEKAGTILLATSLRK